MSPQLVELRDGSKVLIRAVEHSDAALLAAGFARLSTESRQLRFLSQKPALTAAELRYFTEVDHRNHEALGALDAASGRGVGIARFVRHTEDPAAAEIAVVVDDAWQGRGLGTVLLRTLAERARAEGVDRFTALVAAENDSVVGLLHGIGAQVRTTYRDSGTIEYELALAAEDAGTQLLAMLRAFGRRQLTPPAPIRTVLAALLPSHLSRGDP